MLSDNVLIGAMTTFGVIVTALLSYLSYVTLTTRKHARTIRAEVQNSHEVNLRDDLDDKFEGLAGLVKGAVQDIGGIKSDIRDIHKAQLEDRSTLERERARIRALEDTQTRRTTKPKEQS